MPAKPCRGHSPDLQIVQSVSWNLSHLPKSFCKNAWKMTQKDLSFVKNDQKRCQFREKWPKNVYFFEKWPKNVSFSWKMTQTFCEPKMFLGTSLLSYTTICRSAPYRVILSWEGGRIVWCYMRTLSNKFWLHTLPTTGLKSLWWVGGCLKPILVFSLWAKTSTEDWGFGPSWTTFIGHNLFFIKFKHDKGNF